MNKLPIDDAWAARIVQKQGRRNAVCGSPVDIKAVMSVSSASYPKTQSETQFLKGVVCSHPLFMHLNPSQIASVAQAFNVIQCNSGDVLITQGDLDARLFYVVYEGECSVFVSIEDSSTIKVGSKIRGESFGELALMTMSPRAATVVVSSHSARIFSLEREEFQNFVVLSGVLADQNSKNAFAHQSVPEPPDLPLHYMVVPKLPPFHPNCAVLLPQPELARSPVIELSVSGQTFGSRTSTVTSSTLVTYRGLLLQPWPEALNDTMVDVLVPDIDPHTPQKVAARTLMRLNPLVQSTAENLIDLAHLSPVCVVDVLRNRFEWELIYTAVGGMLIAVNPYRDIQHSFSTESANIYLSSSLSQLDVMAPHIFSVAARAWIGMQSAKINSQSIIISGESGAGKTENTKFVLKALCQKRNSSASQDISTMLLAMNPITEAFGNACTVRNRNSSRFGKYIDISFDAAGEICGCHMHSYLLEKTRVVTQASGERNYHIFYQLLAWAEKDSARYSELHLLPRTSYRYLGGQGDKQFDDIKDYDDFIDVVDALHECLFSEQDICHVMRVAALIINLGNLSFNGIDGKQDVDECEVSDNAAAEACCACMQVKRDDLTAAFCTFITKAGLTVVTSKVGKVKAGELRDAFAKMIMKLLFEDVVSKINSAFTGLQDDNRKIGVLDIFGFEIFDRNSLEQLCINYTNEKLQQVFCHHTFIIEQEIYSHEGIDWDHIQFEDNRVCTELFEAQGKDTASWGLFKLLDEQCRYSQPSDEGFFLAFKKNWHPNERERKGAVAVTPAKLQRDCFTIAHYASDVSYHVHGFVEKNVDAFAPSLHHLINVLGNPFLKSIFPTKMYTQEEHSDVQLDKTSSRKNTISSSRVDSSKNTVTNSFKIQVLALMNAINSTVPQFVRCIKPNMQKSDGFFDLNVAERQIVSGGIVDAVSIVQQGFPYRRLFKHFADQYSHLVPALRRADYAAAKLAKKVPSVSNVTNSSSFKRRNSITDESANSFSVAPTRNDRIPDAQRCVLILQQLGISRDRFALGKTLLFLKSGVVGLLEEESARQRYNYATFISKNVKRFIILRRYKFICCSLLLLQCAWRSSRSRLVFRSRRNSIVQLLQKIIRRCLCRFNFVRNYASRTINAASRSSLHRRSYSIQLYQLYHKAKVDAVAGLSPVLLRTLRSMQYSFQLSIRLAICLACGPAIKRLLWSVKYRKQHAALTVGIHSQTAMLANKHRKKYAAYLIGLHLKSKCTLPEFLEHPIRVAFTQKRQFQGNLEKKVNFFHWNNRFFRLNFANGSIEYQTQEGVGHFYGELFFSKDSSVEKQGNAFRLSGTPNKKNFAKTVYVLRASSEIEADRWIENLKKLIDEVKRRELRPKISTRL